MIFVTVGTQLPFSRLITMIDDLALEMSLDIFAQTADQNAVYSNIDHAAFLTPDAYEAVISKTTIIVGHAGIGTILTAKKVEKPVIIVPRKASLGEHRNEHQLATANHLKGHEGVYVAEDRTELKALLAAQDLNPARFSDTPDKTRLQAYLREVVYGRQ